MPPIGTIAAVGLVKRSHAIEMLVDGMPHLGRAECRQVQSGGVLIWLLFSNDHAFIRNVNQGPALM
jgi:hypothetical protein